MKLTKKSIVSTSIGLALMGSLLAASAANAAPTDRYISVSASGIIKVKPDAVRLNLTVSNVSPSGAVALSTANAASAKVRAALSANGITPQYVKSAKLSTFPEYNYTAAGGSVLIGYRASQSFEVIVRNAVNAGTVVDAVVAAGGDSLVVDGVTPYVYDDTSATQSARVAAVSKAKTKAASYAKLLGVKLGSVIFLEESTSGSNYPIMMAMAKSADSGATQVDLGQQDVTVSVSTKWSISG
jgi:hypothetical protein